MYLIPALLFSFSANIDSFIIGISYGVKKTEIRPAQNLLIAAVTLCGTSAALLSGTGILTFSSFPGIAYIGSLILLMLGIYYVLKFTIISYKKHRDNKQNPSACSQQLTVCDVPSAMIRQLSWKESLLLGLSLSANNLGIGIGASIAGLKLLPAAPISFVLSMLFLFLGNLAGQSRIFEKAGQYADLFCGILLIILGFCR